MNDFLKNFNDKADDEIKGFSNSIPRGMTDPCKKSLLGKDYPCKCKQCEEKNNAERTT